MNKDYLILLLLLLITLLIYLIFKKNYYDTLMNIDKVYELAKKSKTIQGKIKLNDLFYKYPKQVNGLKYGYICPGAMKTIEYLNKHKDKPKFPKTTLSRIKLLTDFQFFIEIYVIYRKYLDDKVAKEMMAIIKNNSCRISKLITEEITRLFGELPNKIKKNLPDDFYHIRHNTLICSKNKKLANERIELLKSIYGTIESFNNIHNYTNCLGQRDGVSGCRDCCNAHFKQNYGACVSECMDF